MRSQKRPQSFSVGFPSGCGSKTGAAICDHVCKYGVEATAETSSIVESQLNTLQFPDGLSIRWWFA